MCLYMCWCVCLVVQRHPLTLPGLARLEHYCGEGPRSQRARFGISVVAGSFVKHSPSYMCPLMLTWSQQLLVAASDTRKTCLWCVRCGAGLLLGMLVHMCLCTCLCVEVNDDFEVLLHLNIYLRSLFNSVDVLVSRIVGCLAWRIPQKLFPMAFAAIQSHMLALATQC